MTASYHTPVMLTEAIAALAIKQDGFYVDTTLGGGGYSEAIATALDSGKVFSFDTDEAAIKESTVRLERFGNRVEIVRENFAQITAALAERGTYSIDGIAYDLGVSSNQLDTGSIGLSYRVDAPLDMRLDQRLLRTAGEVVNECSAEELKAIFKRYGEEPQAGAIARRILRAREKKFISTTGQLAGIVGEGIREDKRMSVLSRIFQALRIEVNNELGNLESSLRQATSLLATGGRIVVVSYHSLEDRIVKQLFQRESAPKAEPGSPNFMKEATDYSKATLRLVGRQPMTPTESEIASNPRARSAKMRVAEKIRL